MTAMQMDPATGLPKLNPLFVIAARKSGIPGWMWMRSELVGDDFVVEGGVPRVVMSGPSKGQMTLKGQPTTKVIVTRAELDAEVGPPLSSQG